MKLISIVIAAYNAAPFIGKLLKSIPNDEQIEIIIVNDGSQDETENIVASYAQNDARVKLVNQKNAGVSVARNRGISEATGSWLMFADADDWFDKFQFEALCEKLMKMNDISPVDMIAFGVNHVFMDKKECHCVADSCLVIKEFLRRGNFMEASWNYAFRKEVIDKFDICFPEGIVNTEDQNFNLKVMAASREVWSFDLLVYNYNRKNEVSASHRKHHKVWVESIVESALDLVEFCYLHHLDMESIKPNIAHLLYQFFEDHSSAITIKERTEAYRPAYRRICELIPSFAAYKKYVLPYYSMVMGMLMFKIHDIIKK